MKLEVTKAQLAAIVAITDEISAMMGNGEPEEVLRIRWVKLVDRMLKNNGHEIDFA